MAESYKVNYFAIFYSGFVFSLVRVVLLVYMPIYFFNVLEVNRADFALIQFLSFLVLLISPVAGLIFDRFFERIKLLIVLSSAGAVISFYFFMLFSSVLWIFGLFAALYFFCAVIFSTGINKIIIITVQKKRDRLFFIKYAGNTFGSVSAAVLFIVFLDDIYSLAFWKLYFLLSVLSVLPLIAFALLLKIDKDEIHSLERIKRVKSKNEVVISRIAVVLGFFVLFFVWSIKLVDYLFEPWLLDTYSQGGIVIFSSASIFYLFANVLGFFLASKYSARLDRQKILFLCIALTGFLYILIPFAGFWGIITIFGVFQITGAFITQNLKVLHSNIAKKRGLLFELMQAAYYVAWLILVPGGVYLSLFYDIEVFFIVVGVMMFIGLLPLMTINNEYFLTVEEK